MSQSTLSPDWLTVSQAAAALGISERTVRRRCESGKLAANLATTDNGREWQIEAAAAIGAATAADAAANIGQGADRVRPQNQSILSDVSEAAAIGAATVEGVSDQSTLVPMLREQLADAREMNAFLRGALEARDRDAAELRAALREALKLSNRALPEAGQSTLSSSNDGGQWRNAAPQQAQSTLTTANTPEPMSGPQIERKPMARRTFRRWLLEILRG
jgi:excisionase family DNA binding protein